MTKEEAIKRIQEHMIVHKSYESRAIYITEALEMAIKALKESEKKEKQQMKIKDKSIWNWTFKEIIMFCGDHRNTCEECLFCLGTEFEDCIFAVPPWMFKEEMEL